MHLTCKNISSLNILAKPNFYEVYFFRDVRLHSDTSQLFRFTFSLKNNEEVVEVGKESREVFIKNFRLLIRMRIKFNQICDFDLPHILSFKF